MLRQRMRLMTNLLKRSSTRPCTCPRASSSSSGPTPPLFPFASTSQSTLDTLSEQNAAAPPLSSLVPPGTTLPLVNTKAKNERQHRRRSLKFDNPLDPPRRDRPPAARLQPSPYLPLVTRERNFLLSAFHNELSVLDWDADRLWEALARVIQYPARLPQLPPSYRPSSERTPSQYGLESPEERRTPIQLSIHELRRAFAILARARPRTRTGLSRLLVVVELIALQAARSPLPPAIGKDPDPRALDLQKLRGGGVGLTDHQWKQLIEFAALSYRSPRKSHEVATATSLFAQWKDMKAINSYDEPPKPSVEMYNAMLGIALRGKAWELVDALEERMSRDEVVGNVYTATLRVRYSNLRRVHAQVVWATFEEVMRGPRSRDRETDGEVLPLWNAVIAALGEREQVEDAHRMYRAMRLGKRITLGQLCPQNASPSSASVSRFFVKPPVPDQATYECLIKAYSLRGDFDNALRVLQEMARPTPFRRIVPFKPTANTFSSLFRGFAMHGVPPPESPCPNTLPSTLRKEEKAPTSDVSLTSSSWTLDALRAIFRAFLSLSPPGLSSELSYGGTRSAPSSRQLFWLILAFERLSGSDSGIVIDMWETVVEAFKQKPDPRRQAKRWRGWFVDQRVHHRIEEHRRRKLEVDAQKELPKVEG